MASKTKKPVKSNSLKSSFWVFDRNKKIVSAVIFFVAAAVSLFLLLPGFQYGFQTSVETIAAGVLLLMCAYSAIQVARHNNRFVVILLGIAFLGGFAGFGARAYSDYVDSQKIVVLVLKLAGKEDQYHLTDQIYSEVQSAASGFQNVKLVRSEDIVTGEEGSVAARELGQKFHADLVVWGWYQASVQPLLSIFIEDNNPEIIQMPLPADPKEPQPVYSFLGDFQVRRMLTAKTDSMKNLLVAILHYKSGEYQAFLDTANQVLETKDTTNVVLPYYLRLFIANSHSMRGEYQLAADAYTAALKEDRKGAASYVNRALAYYYLGQYDLALRDLDTAYIIDKTFAPTFNARGMVFLAEGKYDQAVKQFSAALITAPDEARIYYNRALAYQGMGMPDPATADFKRAAQIRGLSYP